MAQFATKENIGVLEDRIAKYSLAPFVTQEWPSYSFENRF
jgi:hypothetical protein